MRELLLNETPPHIGRIASTYTNPSDYCHAHAQAALRELWEDVRSQRETEPYQICSSHMFTKLKAHDIVFVGDQLIIIGREDLESRERFVDKRVQLLGSCATELYIMGAGSYFDGSCSRLVHSLVAGVVRPPASERHESFEQDEFNESQLGVVGAASTLSTGQLLLVQGPPGTGKTTTLVRVIRTIDRCGEGSLLICAPSNKAVSNVLMAGRFTMHEAILFGARDKIDPSVEWFHIDVRRERLGYLRAATMDQNSSVTSKIIKSNDDADGEFDFSTLIDRLLEDEPPKDHEFDTRPWSAPSCVLMARREIRARLQAVETMDFRFVFSTVASTGGYQLRSESFECAVVDEACQGREADMLIPLARGIGRLVLVGDPQQLQSTVKSDVCKRSGLGTSMMERLCSLGHVPMLLDTQYRMHPDIVSLPNRLFYGDRLKTVHMDKFPPNASLARYTVNQIAGFSERSDSSICNKREGRQVLKYVTHIKREWPDASIGVITPYRAQAACLIKMLRPDTAVGTVDAFQVDPQHRCTKRKIYERSVKCFVLFCSGTRTRRDHILMRPYSESAGYRLFRRQTAAQCRHHSRKKCVNHLG